MFNWLLDLQWINYDLPAEPELIQGMLPKMPDDLWAKIWPVLEPLFPLDAETQTRANPRLTRIREDMEELSAKRKRAGRKGGKAAPILLKQKANKTASKTQAKEGESESEGESEFENIWKAYPGKVGTKATAAKKIKALLSAGEKAADLRLSCERYGQELEITGYKPKYASTFFGLGEHWREYVDEDRWAEKLAAAKKYGGNNGQGTQYPGGVSRGGREPGKFDDFKPDYSTERDSGET